MEMGENSVVVQPSVRISKTPNEERAVELCRQVRELFEQYRAEVPKKRRPWPESIRKRILELWALGMSSHQIGQEAGIPVMTLYSWRQRIKKEGTGFSEIALTRGKRRTRFQISEDEKDHSSQLQLSQLESRPTTEPSTSVCITVILPNGVRLEGVPTDQVARIVTELSER